MTFEYLGGGPVKIGFEDGTDCTITNDEINELFEYSEKYMDMKSELIELKSDREVFKKASQQITTIAALIEGLEDIVEESSI